MKTFCVALISLWFSSLFETAVSAIDLNGLWTKTTSPDPNNITIFFHEKNDAKAVGYSEMDGKKVVWYAEGKISGNLLRCTYRYAENATPPGWEQEGVMDLTLSGDGNAMIGTATSLSKNWAGIIGFVRVGLYHQVEKWTKSDLTQNPDPFSGSRSSSPPTSFDRQGQLGIPVFAKQVE